MNVIFYLLLALPVAASLLAAVGARPLAERLEPRTATWLLTALAVVLAGCTSVVLGLLALGGAIRLPFVAELGRLSLDVLRRGDPVATPVALAATVLLAAAVVSVTRAVRRDGRALAAACRQARRLSAAGPVVVVPDEAVDAFALPAFGRLPGHVVVSTGMLEVLDEDEQGVLLAHEQAHLRGRHHLFLLTSRLAAALNPFLAPVARTVAYTVERWADERAAAVTGRRRLAACAIGKAALARNGSRRLSAQWAMHATAGPVPRRVAALLAPPQRSRRWLALTTAAVLAATGLAAVVATEQLHELIKLARLYDR